MKEIEVKVESIEQLNINGEKPEKLCKKIKLYKQKEFFDKNLNCIIQEFLEKQKKLNENK